LVVGDVSGKGVPAALMMAVCKTLLKSSACNGFSTANILSHVNNEMAKDNSKNMFVTVFMAILNTSTGEMTYTNAGHSPTYIKKKSGELIKLSKVHGPVIAAIHGLRYKEEKIMLEPGDILFAYTDGITEAHNETGELFSDQKLCNLLLSPNFSNIEGLVKNIIQTTKLFEGSREQFDDITALCVEYKGTISEENKLMLLDNGLTNIEACA
jgi:sigma-B regulation protein RsbU (phosphoserine phosphatase)